MSAKNKRSFLRILGYIAFFVVCFVVSLVITFPYDRLTGFAEEKARTAMGIEVSIDKLRPTITGGVRLDGVTLGPSLKTSPMEEPSTEPYVHIDSANIGISWIGLALGSTSVSFDLDLAGGEAEGSFEQNEEHLALLVNFNGLQAKQLPLLQAKVGLPMKGTVMGSIDLDVPAGHADEGEGAFQLGLQGVVIGDGEARLSLGSLMGYGGGSTDPEDGTKVPPIKLGPVNIQSKLEKGVANIPRVESKSDHAELSFEGRITLAEPLAQSRVDTYLTVKLTQTYADQDEEIAGLLSMADSVGGRAKRSDGSFGFRMSGTFGSGLSFRPAKNYTPPGGSAGRRGPRSGARRPNPRRRPPRAGNRANNTGDSQRPTITPPPSITPPPTSPRPTQPPPTSPGQDLYPSGMPRPQPSESQNVQYDNNQQQQQNDQYQNENE